MLLKRERKKSGREMKAVSEKFSLLLLAVSKIPAQKLRLSLLFLRFFAVS